MRPSVLIIGATGLVGKTFLDTASKNEGIDKLIVLTRREIPSLKNNSLYDQHIINFEKLSEYKNIFNAGIIVSALGTTIKKAGSEAAMHNIDYEIPMKAAEYGMQNGAKYFILVSSIGADPASKNFYLRLKGELERDLAKYEFEGLHIIRPSLLLGSRNEFRFGEKIAQIFAPLYKPFLPYKYKPVKASVVAAKIYSLCVNPAKGVRVYEGREIQ